MSKGRIHFVTGRLAEPALRETVDQLSKAMQFDYTIQVMPITVAALMTGEWIAKRLELPPGTTQVLLPGHCGAGLEHVRAAAGVGVELGPRDLRDLPAYFSQPAEQVDLSNWDIEILAEINDAPNIPLDTLLHRALDLAASGAQIIDLGASPHGGWKSVGQAVGVLRNAGMKVSIDSFDVAEVKAATAAGAELVLSVNSSNREMLADVGAEFVVVPDDPCDWECMEETISFLERRGARFRLDPILEPIGMGFAASVKRFFDCRNRWPDVPMLMGVGNLTELSDCDSAGINFLLLALCQELKIQSVLTTQVINWARTSVSECDWARRIIRAALDQRVPPKRMADNLVMLRDPKVNCYGRQTLLNLADRIKDRNVRIFAEPDGLYALTEQKLWNCDDPFELFESIEAHLGYRLDVSHAFYLGYELCKAELSRQLGKQYEQDEPLRWGLAGPEDSGRRHRRLRRFSRPDDSP